MQKIRFPLLATIAVLAFCFNFSRANGEQNRTFPAFTLLSQVTDCDSRGKCIPAYTEARYYSSSGDWRYRAEYPNGSYVETIFRYKRGVYFPDYVGNQVVKIDENVTGEPKATTARLLQSDPKFSRTELTLGLTAYVISDHINGYAVDTYFVPQLGKIPFKRGTFFQTGYTRYEQPVSVIMGEPERSLVQGPTFPTVEQKVSFVGDLNDKAESRPAPFYSQAAQALGIAGTVRLQVVVDETGRVFSARSLSIPLPILDEAAMAAAFKARIAPTEVDGIPVKVMGTITYKFTLPQLSWVSTSL